MAYSQGERARTSNGQAVSPETLRALFYLFLLLLVISVLSLSRSLYFRYSTLARGMPPGIYCAPRVVVVMVRFVSREPLPLKRLL